MTSPGAPSVAIIGAGFGGLCTAIRLKQAGFDRFTVYEKAADIGGTWRDNTYPGASCDIPSHVYSYSFAPHRDPQVRYPDQAAILGYLRRCVETFGIGPHLRFGHEVEAMDYDEQTGRWTLRTVGGADHEADVVVTAVGQLSLPRIPDLPGLDQFAGASIHTARWDHAFDFEGKDVAVVGTGSSAAQVIPVLAGKARKLHVVQRSAPWLLPKPGPRFGLGFRAAFRLFPPLHRAYRALVSARSELVLLPALRRGPTGAILRYLGRSHLNKQVRDPGLKERVTPSDPVGCKRVVLSNDFYPTLARENVELVTDAITDVTADGIRTADGTHRRLDAIVWATGFRTTEFLAPIRVTGRAGRDLHDEWHDGARAYLGLAKPGFPNLFFVYGPNTNLGHNSIVLMHELQADYLTHCVALLAERGPGELEVTDAAMAEFGRMLDESLAGTVWNDGCHSWFKDDHGRITTNWPQKTARYRRLVRTPDLTALRYTARLPRDPATVTSATDTSTS